MNNIIEWLLEGDVSIQYLTKKYLMNAGSDELQHLRNRIALEGWGRKFLDARNENGHWGRGFYQPKWISSHYTLLDLRYLEIESVEPTMETLALILQESKSPDGSINESKTVPSGDLCVNGMFLNYASFFGVPEIELKSVVDYILKNQMPDGGFNCEITRKNPVHSSMHTTTSVLEGILEYTRSGNQYRVDELSQAKRDAEVFLLKHRLYKSSRSREIIDKKWTMLSFPSRWRYDILRALVYFVDAGVPYDPRMNDAVNLLKSKQRKDGTWPVQAKHPGQVHFDMENTGTPSRFNTLRALRVLSVYDISTSMPNVSHLT
ncbi:MAG: hypothetical protein P1P73_06600 [Brevefilum sp.]|nr:hypothetical protein [Brevefilum sp.]